MRERSVVRFLKEYFGGSIQEVKGRDPRHSTTYRWVTVGEGAVSFANQVLPYLRAKSKQAKLTKSFQSLKRVNGNRPVSDSTYLAYQNHKEKMGILNRKGVGK